MRGQKGICLTSQGVFDSQRRETAFGVVVVEPVITCHARLVDVDSALSTFMIDRWGDRIERWMSG